MDWSYLAGFFDADGSISYYKRRNRSPVVLYFFNTNKKVLEEIKKFINAGHIYEKDYKNSDHYGKKPVYSLEISPIEDVRGILEDIVRFSIIKRNKLLKGLKKLGSDFDSKPEMNWSYIAGFFDGDGCITKEKIWRIILTNTNKKVLESIRDFIGFGRIYSYRINRLKINMQDTLTFIKKVKDKIIVRKPKVLECFEKLKDREFYPNYKLKHIPEKKLKKKLIKMYHKEKMSLREIAKKFGVSYEGIYYHFKKFDIPRRSYSEAGNLS